MPQPKFLTGIDADVEIGGVAALIGARWTYRANTDFHPANRLGTRFKTYGIGQTGGIVTVEAPWESGVDPFDTLQQAEDGPLTITAETGVVANCTQVGVMASEVTVDADGNTIWRLTLICMGNFEDFSGNTDADGRDPGVNE
jgi:hypothetical protein